MTKYFLLFAVLLLPLLLTGYEGTPIGGEPYEKWEDGSNGYFVMFNSLIDDQITLYNEGENRQPDTCILESSFKLNNLHIPTDAWVDQSKAYLVWMGAVDPAKFNDPADNMVHLKFDRADGAYSYEEDIVAGDAPKTLGDTTDPFLFQSVQFNTDVISGCSDAAVGIKGKGDVAYFTYRTDVTPFFQKIFDDNRASDYALEDGEALYGTYTFSGLDCTEDDAYRCNGTMVSNWSIFFVYKSGNVRSKRIYLYPGFAFLKGETMTATVSGFDLPKNPVVHLTSLVAGGEESTLFDQASPLEQMYIKGEGATSTYQLINDCNSYVAGRGYEVYNSNSSVYGWDPQDESMHCVTGGTEGSYPGIDVDTFLLNSEDDINLQEHLKKDMTGFDVTFSVNRDAILTNYLVVARDTKPSYVTFDIPPAASYWPNDREKHYCSCSSKGTYEQDVVCEERPFYYFIKVQNWGNIAMSQVMVRDELPAVLDYVHGTTEMATLFDEYGNGTDWTAIPDKAGQYNEVLPLSGEGYQVADTMAECDTTTWTCADTRLIRFQAKSKTGLPPNTIIENTATITAETGLYLYATNRSMPLMLRFDRGGCPPQWECPDASKADCRDGGFLPPVDNDDDVLGTDEDALASDELAPDDDTSTPKSDGCGCSVVF